MAARIHELKAIWAALVKEANTAFDVARALAEEEGRELGDDERAAQDAFDVKIVAAKTAYDDEATKNARLAELGSAGPVPGAGPQLVVGDVGLRAESDPKPPSPGPSSSGRTRCSPPTPTWTASTSSIAVSCAADGAAGPANFCASSARSAHSATKSHWISTAVLRAGSFRARLERSTGWDTHADSRAR